MSLRTPSILVTGASGYIGRRLCQRLREEGEIVVALGRKRVAGPWDRFIEADLGRGGLPAGQLEGVRTVYHLASAAQPQRGDTDGGYSSVIVEGTRCLLDECKAAGVRRFIHFSTVKVMGEGNPHGLPLMPMTEEWPHTPQCPFGLAKAEAEFLVRKAGIPHSVILRPVKVYGCGERGNLWRMREAIRMNRFPPFPECGNKRSLLHVEDLVEFAIRAAKRPRAAGRTYILASGKPVSTHQLYKATRQSLGLKEVRWAVPLWLLHAAASAGSLLGAVTGRRRTFDREMLGQLTRSAWYAATRAEEELAYISRRDVLDWLVNGD